MHMISYIAKRARRSLTAPSVVEVGADSAHESRQVYYAVETTRGGVIYTVDLLGLLTSDEVSIERIEVHRGTAYFVNSCAVDGPYAAGVFYPKPYPSEAEATAAGTSAANWFANAPVDDEKFGPMIGARVGDAEVFEDRVKAFIHRAKIDTGDLPVRDVVDAVKETYYAPRPPTMYPDLNSVSIPTLAANLSAKLEEMPVPTTSKECLVIEVCEGSGGSVANADPSPTLMDDMEDCTGSGDKSEAVDYLFAHYNIVFRGVVTVARPPVVDSAVCAYTMMPDKTIIAEAVDGGLNDFGAGGMPDVDEAKRFITWLAVNSYFDEELQD